MMRKSHTKELKFKVALEAIKDDPSFDAWRIKSLLKDTGSERPPQ